MMTEAVLDDLVALLPPLLQSLEALGFVARHVNPPDLADVVRVVGTPDEALRAIRPRLGAWPDEFSDVRGQVSASIYVPETYSPDRAHPLIMALHGGGGRGRAFLWSWLRDARSRGAILVAPTSLGSTWSLSGDDVDTPHLAQILEFVSAHWRVDPNRLLLTGMSDGGTFSYVSGLEPASPFTHLAPSCAAFHPMLAQMADAERLRGLPIHITHGALDWMFPVADLPHCYPREINPDLLAWLADTPVVIGETMAGPSRLPFDTLSLHAGQHPDPVTGARAVPDLPDDVLRVSGRRPRRALFNLETRGHLYTRISNPTIAVLEERLAALEGGVGAVATASGMAALHLAIATLLECRRSHRRLRLALWRHDQSAGAYAAALRHHDDLREAARSRRLPRRSARTRNS
jgi:predicted esterase